MPYMPCMVYYNILQNICNFVSQEFNFVFQELVKKNHGNKRNMLTFVLRYSPAKQKTKASMVTARNGMINCIITPDLLSVFISKDCTHTHIHTHIYIYNRILNRTYK